MKSETLDAMAYFFNPLIRFDEALSEDIYQILLLLMGLLNGLSFVLSWVGN